MLVFDIETGPLPEDRLREIMPPCDLLPHPGEFIPGNVKLGQMKDQTKIDAKIADAKAKAETLAKSLGVKLVKIINFQESGNYPIYYAMESKATGGVSSAPVLELPVGEDTITSNVTLTYEIQ